ncbi:unnamed protein product [Lota lota]
MGEDSSHAERCSNSSSSPSSPLQPLQQAEKGDLLIPSFGGNSTPPTPSGTLARMGFKMPTSPTSPGSPADRGQVSAITVVALLDKLVNMLDAVQENQQRMEMRQAELEGAVKLVQGDISRLTKTHTTTAHSVNKLLERSRKVGESMKEVKERMDKQATMVKRLENNHHNLLKRNHFKVVIFQEDSEIPTSVVVKDSLKSPPSQFDAESVLPAPSIAGSVDANFGTDEGLQTISLSSDEGEDAQACEDDAFLECEASMAVGTSSTLERSRAEKLKRSSLKKVDSLMKAFSRQSIEKKMTQIGTKIVPQEHRDKIKKSFTPNHPKSPTSRNSSFKLSPMTFNVKKVRDSVISVQDSDAPGEMVHVEIPALGSMDGEASMAEVQDLAEGLAGEAAEALLAPSTLKSINVEHVVNGDSRSVEGAHLSCNRTATLALPEQDKVDGENEKEGGKEQQQADVGKDVAKDVAKDVMADVAAHNADSMAAVAVEQAS